MKKIIIAILVLASFLKIEAAQVQFHANKDAQGVVLSYQVWTWNGPDHGMVITQYTLQEVQVKFPSIFDKAEAGTTKNPDRVFLNYTPEGTIYSIDFQVTSTKLGGGEFELKPKSQPEISGKLNTEALTVKGDIETKTGNDIGGGPIKPTTPPPVEEPVNP